MKTITFIHRIFARLATLAAVAALALPAPAFAQFAETEGNFYASAEIGQVKIKDWCQSSGDFAVTACDDSEIAWGGDVGYRFNDYFAAEAGFRLASGFKGGGVFTADLRDARGDVVIPRGTVASAETDVTQFMFGVRASYPIAINGVFVFGKAGLNLWDFEADASLDAFPLSVSEDGNNPYFGAGVGYVVNETIEARVGFTRFIYDEGNTDEDADLIAASGAFRF